MGKSPKTVRPTPAPPPIPPVTAESEDVKLASEANMREMRRKKGRKSTLITPSTNKQDGNRTLLG